MWLDMGAGGACVREGPVGKVGKRGSLLLGGNREKDAGSVPARRG